MQFSAERHRLILVLSTIQFREWQPSPSAQGVACCAAVVFTMHVVLQWFSRCCFGMLKLGNPLNVRAGTSGRQSVDFLL